MSSLKENVLMLKASVNNLSTGVDTLLEDVNFLMQFVHPDGYTQPSKCTLHL